jgi:hypothetical protein
MMAPPMTPAAKPGPHPHPRPRRLWIRQNYAGESGEKINPQRDLPSSRRPKKRQIGGFS